MPTPSGLPKKNEVWSILGREVRILQRMPGAYWSLRVVPLEKRSPNDGKEFLIVDAPWHLQRGELEFIRKEV